MKGSPLTFVMKSFDGTQGVDFIPKARIDQTIRIGEMVWKITCNYFGAFCLLTYLSYHESHLPFICFDAEKSELIGLESRGAFVGECIHRCET